MSKKTDRVHRWTGILAEPMQRRPLPANGLLRQDVNERDRWYRGVGQRLTALCRMFELPYPPKSDEEWHMLCIILAFNSKIPGFRIIEKPGRKATNRTEDAVTARAELLSLFAKTKSAFQSEGRRTSDKEIAAKLSSTLSRRYLPKYYRGRDKGVSAALIRKEIQLARIEASNEELRQEFLSKMKSDFR